MCFHTVDGGNSWARQTITIPQNYNLKSIFFVDQQNGWTVGIHGYIFRTTNGGVSFIKDETELPNEFILHQNYPNPFNPTTTINYQIPQTEFVILKVYDILGREVAILVNEEKPAGSYEVQFEGSGLTSGIYFYQLKAGEYSETKKMILLK